MSDINISTAKQVYGLSCVENQVLTIMENNGINISPVYAHSGIPLKDLFVYFIENNGSYENFDIIPRVQDTLKELGIITLSLNKSNVAKLKKSIFDTQKDEYILAKIAPEYVKKNLFARGWRNDHFVLITNEDGYRLTNDIPKITKNISEDELSEIYAGEYFKLKIIKNFTQNDIKFLWENRMFKPENEVEYNFINENQINLLDNIEKLRNMTVVYKVSRCRVKTYYSQYFDTAFMDEYIAEIEKILAFLGYVSIRKNADDKKIFETLQQLFDIHNILIKYLKENINERKN